MIGKILAWAGGTTALVACALAAPVIWTETVCRAEPRPQAAPRFLTASEDQRPEARTFLVYPEWHIVYAYEEYAAARARGPADKFAYTDAIKGFWTSLCGVRAEADTLGDPGTDAKITIYTIGLSFSLEMMMKGAYEESIGRLAAWAGGDDTPQDALERDMAHEYGVFLHQTPWYLFDFEGWRDRLKEAPTSGLRSWERRLALGAEWKAKALYADVITEAVGTMEPDETTMRIHVSGIDAEAVRDLPHAKVLRADAEGLVLDVDRYRTFTRTAESLAARGAVIDEIAGNDDIMVSLRGDFPRSGLDDAEMISTIAGASGSPDRQLVKLKVPRLTSLIRNLGAAGLRLEHIYDY